MYYKHIQENFVNVKIKVPHRMKKPSLVTMEAIPRMSSGFHGSDRIHSSHE